jgi:hypothetical protein
VKFDFYLESLLHTSPEQSQMIMKCTNLIQRDTKNPDDDDDDDDNQDSKTKKNNNTWSLFLLLANEMIIKNEQNDHQDR